MSDKTMNEYWYSVPEHCEESRYLVSTSVLCVWKIDKEVMAERCARLYFSRDGCLNDWPLTFVVYESEDGPEIFRATVSMEMEPVFSAKIESVTEGE